MDPVTPDLTHLTKILSIPVRQTLQALPDRPALFSEGQLIKATVQGVLDSVVWLKADGQMLQARTELPLQADQQVLLKVVEANPLRVQLQVQSPSSPNPPLDFKTLLASWGLDADETNLAIAQALFTQAHTVNPDDVETIRTVWLTLPSLDPAFSTTAPNGVGSLEALTYLHTARLPLNSETLALARRWLDGLSPLPTRLAALQQSLDTVLEQLAPLKANQPALAELHDTLQAARTQIANWPVSPEQPRPQVIAGLTALLHELGTPAEAKVAALPSRSLSSLAGSDLPAGLSPTALAATIQKEVPSLPPARPEASSPGGVLERLAAAVTRAVAQGGLDPPTTQALHRLAGHLDHLADDLSAGQMANLANTLSPAAEPCYIFPLLLATPNGPRQAHLKLYPQPGQSHLDPQNVRLAILLDLPSLGEIAIDLTVSEHHLNGRILSRQSQTNELVEIELGRLAAGLSSLGYKVDALTSGLLAPPAPPAQPANLSGIDVSA